MRRYLRPLVFLCLFCFITWYVVPPVALATQIVLASGMKINADILRSTPAGLVVEFSATELHIHYNELTRLPGFKWENQTRRRALIPFSALMQSAPSRSSSDSPGRSNAPPQGSGFECFAQGETLARRDVSTGGNMAGGFVLGLTLGLIGTGIGYAVAGKPEPRFSAIPQGQRECQIAFSEGYRQEGQAMKRSAALEGGAIGTVVLVLLVVAANSGQ